MSKIRRVATYVLLPLVSGLGLLGLLLSAMGTVGLVVDPSFRALFLPSFLATVAAGGIAGWLRRPRPARRHLDRAA